MQDELDRIRRTVTGRFAVPPELITQTSYRRTATNAAIQMQHAEIDFAEIEKRLMATMFGDSKMCGACIGIKLTKGFPDKPHKCQLCGTEYPGNRRREAVLHTRRKRACRNTK